MLRLNSCCITVSPSSKISKRLFFLILVLLLSSAACKDGAKEQPAEAPYSQAELSQYVKKWSERLPDKLLDDREFFAVRDLISKGIDVRAPGTAPLPTKPGDPMRPPNFALIMKQVYKDRDGKPGFVDDKGLTAAAKATIQAIENAPSEAYAADEFDLKSIKEMIPRFEKLIKDTNLEELKLNKDELQWAEDHVKGKLPSSYPLNETSMDMLSSEFVAEKGGRLKELVEKYKDNIKGINVLKARLEVELAELYLHYAFEEKYSHIRSIFIHPRQDDYYNDPEIRKSRPDKAMGPYVAGNVWRHAAQVAESARNDTNIAKRNLTKSLEDLLSSDNPADVVAQLQPQEPQYQKLVSELNRYNEIVEKGGWSSVGSPNIRPGSRGASVLALKKRLAAEGYDVNTSKDLYDQQLTNAVKAYQASHQYAATGVPQRNLWPSINVPAKVRRDQIALNIKRWRKSNIDFKKDKTFVFVNIPDFNLELWDQGDRKMRFAVVVGNNDSEIDEESKKRVWKNRTPVPLSAYIDRVIYNPYWNVTPRIREDEILPEVQKEVAKEYADLKEQYQIALGNAPAVANASESAPNTPQPNQPKPSTTDPNSDDYDLLEALRKSARPAPPKPDPAKAEILRQKIENFPYFNKETGEIDVTKTDPNNVPKWYANHNYEVVRMGPNWEYVRMTQGPHNALGKVKVIFPNYYDVYLHDTPAKAKFKSTLRAFSHGCIRMEEPLEFAKYLLDREGKYESEDVPKILASGKYQPIFFSQKIPVFLEYYTVRVDDNGRANFLADPYDFDEKGIVYPTPPANRHLEP